MKPTIKDSILFIMGFTALLLLAGEAESDKIFYWSKVLGLGLGYATYKLYQYWAKAAR